ncbi:unnamed protein product [Caenorhabditis sp. 36 PRJEB53466]|nr:unnamed protein product [Caenorhabditis sp. 36 PRJEB53466]
MNLVFQLVLSFVLPLPVVVFANTPDVVYLTSIYQPHFIPCKYGSLTTFQQPHYVSVAGDVSKEAWRCPKGCETMHVPVPYTNRKAIVCCLPETPWKHRNTISGGEKAGVIKTGDSLNGLFKVTNWLSLSFPEVVPRAKPNGTRSKRDTIGQENDRKVLEGSKSATKGSFGFMLIGAAIAQALVLAVVVFAYYGSDQRIVLEAPSDCDYEIKPEVKVHNPSKSMMMSENMNSDLMSMSQGAL